MTTLKKRTAPALVAMALLLGAAPAAAAGLDSFLPPPSDPNVLNLTERDEAADAVVRRWEASKQADVDALIKGGATRAEAEAAINERIDLGWEAVEVADYEMDVTPALDALQARLSVLALMTRLGHERFAAFAAQQKLSVPESFYGCMCNAHSTIGNPIGYHPAPTEDCDNSAPCKGGNWGCVAYGLPQDPKVWSRCLAASATEGEGGHLLDQIVAVVGRAQQQEAHKQVCAAVTEHWQPRRAQLNEQVTRGRAALNAWVAQQERFGDEGARSWVRSMVDAVVGPDVKPVPGYMLAELNQNIGALKCLDEVARHCEGPPAPGSPVAGQSAFGAYAQTLASEIRQRSDAEFALSLERKAVFERNPNDTRWGTEANQMVGFADMCREVAAHLGGLEPPAAVAGQ